MYRMGMRAHGRLRGSPGFGVPFTGTFMSPGGGEGAVGQELFLGGVREALARKT